MDHLAAGDLEVRVTEKPGCLVLEWKGRSNDRQPGRLLDPYFAKLVDEAAAGQSSIEMHFEALDHFNSSTITTVIQFIQTARSAGVRLAIVYDSTLQWQKLSFEAMRVFSQGDGMLELRPKSP